MKDNTSWKRFVIVVALTASPTSGSQRSDPTQPHGLKLDGIEVNKAFWIGVTESKERAQN